MLLPLMGFVAGCVVFTILGLIVLASIPKLRLTITNLSFLLSGHSPELLPPGISTGASLPIQQMS